MKKDVFWWKIYFLLFSFYVLYSIYNSISQTSFLFIYHHTLISFDSGYQFPYFIMIFQLAFNIISLVPLFLYVFEIPYENFRIWQWLFVLRTALDVTGHGGDIKQLKAIYYMSQPFFWMTIVFLSCLILPSYVACFQYAFQWQQLFKNKT